MKKTFIIVTTLCALMATTCLGQEKERAQPKEKPSDEREKFAIGLRAGFNYCSTFDTHPNDISDDTKFAFAGGAYFTASISKYLGLQFEVLYSRRQVEISGVLPSDVNLVALGSKYEVNRKTSYIDMPLYMQFKEGEHLVFLAGPTYSHLISSKDTHTLFGTEAENAKSMAVFQSMPIRQSVFGFGGGIDYRIKHFVIGVRAYRDLQDTNGNDTILAPYYKNKFVQVSLGYKII